MNPSNLFHPRGFICTAIAMMVTLWIESQLGIRNPNPLLHYGAVLSLSLSLALLWRIILG